MWNRATGRFRCPAGAGRNQSARAKTYVFLRIVPDHPRSVIFRHTSEPFHQAKKFRKRLDKTGFQLVSHMEGTHR
jgi:hypothetical protein